MKSPVISGNCRHVLKKLESDEFDERMDAVIVKTVYNN